jgi:pteridine reductase
MPTALITGAAKRIGKAIALELADAGYDIALHYHTSREEAKDTAAQIAVKGRRATLFCADLSDLSAVDALIQEVFKAHPECTVLVNNASLFKRGTLKETTGEQLIEHFTANSFTPMLLTQGFARHAKGGAVVNMLDTHITRTHDAHAAYLLSKKTLAEFTRMAARAFAPVIRVNGVAPGVCLTPDASYDAYASAKRTQLPMQTLVTPEQIAHAVRYCITAEALTGQILYLDGGEHLL